MHVKRTFETRLGRFFSLFFPFFGGHLIFSGDAARTLRAVWTPNEPASYRHGWGLKGCALTRLTSSFRACHSRARVRVVTELTHLQARDTFLRVGHPCLAQEHKTQASTGKEHYAVSKYWWCIQFLDSRPFCFSFSNFSELLYNKSQHHQLENWRLYYLLFALETPHSNISKVWIFSVKTRIP